MSDSTCDREFDFTLVLDGVDEITTDVEDKVFEAGCSDCTIAMRYGRMYLTFSRSADSKPAAIISAIKDVRASGIGATVLRVDECDLVTQSDIARRISRTRRAVNQYITGVRGPGGFPPPVCNIVDGHPLWFWCEVAFWLFENDLIREDESQLAHQLAVINNILELQYQKQLDPDTTNEIRSALE